MLTINVKLPAMSKIFFVISTLLLGIEAFPQPAQCQTLWRGLTVGMSAEEIQLKYKNAHKYYEGKNKFERFGLENLTIDNCFLNVNFLLNENKLIEVQISLNNKSTTGQHCQIYIINSLFEKYGDTKVNKGFIINNATWTLNDNVKIIADWAGSPDVNKYIIHIRYFSYSYNENPL